MPFIDRDEMGLVQGYNALEQHKRQEFLPEGHPELLEYENRITRPSELTVEERLTARIEALETKIEKLEEKA